MLNIGPRIVRTAFFSALGLAAMLLGDAAKPAAAYHADLSKMPVGKPTDELFLLNGAFTIAEDGGKKVLELPGNPVDTFGVLFGPEAQTATEVSAKIFGTKVEKLFPEFGIGANDSGGWKLWLIPSQNAVVLRKNDEEKSRVAFNWTSGGWTNFRLKVGMTGPARWAIAGKVWASADKEPPEWTILVTDAVAPPTGRASVWGQPYSGTAIRFDALAVDPVK